jgi:ribosomal protein L7Ae-like RNA K-turn-binding protein
LALFGCKVEVAVITDAKQRTLEFYGDKNYNRKVQRGESGCFKAIDSREIVVEVIPML